MKSLEWILKYLKVYRVRYIFGLALILLVSVLALVNPYITGQIVKEVFEGGNTDALRKFVLIMISVTFVKSIIKYCAQIFVMESVSQNVIRNLRRDIYKRIQDQSFSFFDSNRTGDIMARMTGDLDAVRHFISHVIYSLLENTVVFFAALFMMLRISPILTLSMIFVAPLIGFLAVRQATAIKPYFTKIREQFSHLNSVCQENISGNRVVKAFTREEFEIKKFTAENQAYYDANVDSYKIWTKYLPAQEFLAGALSVILILVGGFMVINDRLELWQLITINGYLWAVNNPMRIIGWLVNDVQRFFASLDKIHAMMRLGSDIKNPENAIVKDKLKGSVEFKNVSFKYAGDTSNNKILKNISFKAEPGETIGIVGPTGSGKTTMMNLLCRFYDVSDGSILVDGTDVKKFDLQSLRSGITSAMQDVFLFSDTIEGNIAYGVPDAPMEDVISAAITADANNFILETSDSYDTIVGERGVGLSGGQKQRLSLARAIAPNPSILILDDTTSAVDMETEHGIQQALKEKYDGITKFIIAHRISSVMHADLILVLVDGKLIEKGTHDELMLNKGYYYDLFISQYGDYYKQNLKQMQNHGQVSFNG